MEIMVVELRMTVFLQSCTMTKLGGTFNRWQKSY